jgi:metal-dependent amidase/aminoacylase/carboxypeptidase family protein
MASGKHRRGLFCFKGFAKDEATMQTNKAVAELANNCNLGVDSDGYAELPEEVPEESTNEELVELEQECTTEEEEREVETKRAPKKIHSEEFSRYCSRSQQAPERSVMCIICLSADL